MLIGSDPRYKTHLVASRQTVQEIGCARGGYAASPPKLDECSNGEERKPAI
jgi:hypothetical protein